LKALLSTPAASSAFRINPLEKTFSTRLGKVTLTIQMCRILLTRWKMELTWSI